MFVISSVNNHKTVFFPIHGMYMDNYKPIDVDNESYRLIMDCGNSQTVMFDTGRNNLYNEAAEDAVINLKEEIIKEYENYLARTNEYESRYFRITKHGKLEKIGNQRTLV